MAAKDIEAGRAHILLMLKDQATRSLAAVSQRFHSVGKGFIAAGGALSAGAAVAGGTLIKAAKDFSEFGDQMHKMSIRTKASAEWLSQMKFASEQSGTSIESLGAAVFRFNRRIANAQTETGPAVRALNELGLSAEQLSQMSTPERLDAIADALGAMQDPLRANQLGFEIFGDNFKDLQPLLAEGSAGMAALRKQAHELGLTMSTDDAAAAAAFGDATNAMMQSVKAAWRSIGAAVAPTLTRIMNIIAKAIAVGGQWINNNRQLFTIILAVSGALGTLGAALTIVGGVFVGLGAIIGAVMPVISAIGAAIGAITVPALILAAAIAALMAAYVAWGVAIWNAMSALGLTSEIVAGVRATFLALWATVRQTGSGISNALSAGKYMLAVRILWSGIKLLFWQGAGAALDALSYMWDNAYRFATAFFMAFSKLTVNTFLLLPKLLTSALRGNLNFAKIIAQSLQGDLGLRGAVDERIAKARAELQGLTREAAAANRAANPSQGGQGQFINQQREQLDLLKRQQAAAANGNANRPAGIPPGQEQLLAQQRQQMEVLQNQRARLAQAQLAAAKIPQPAAAAKPAMPESQHAAETARNTRRMVDLMQRPGGGQAQLRFG